MRQVACRQTMQLPYVTHLNALWQRLFGVAAVCTVPISHDIILVLLMSHRALLLRLLPSGGCQGLVACTEFPSELTDAQLNKAVHQCQACQQA